MDRGWSFIQQPKDGIVDGRNRNEMKLNGMKYKDIHLGADTKHGSCKVGVSSVGNERKKTWMS